VAEYNTLMRYLISLITLGHFQQPSVAAKMTVQEFVRAKASSDGHMIILVADHKTGAQGPAQLALKPDDYKLFSLFSKRSVCKNILKTLLYINALADDLLSVTPTQKKRHRNCLCNVIVRQTCYITQCLYLFICIYVTMPLNFIQ